LVEVLNEKGDNHIPKCSSSRPLKRGEAPADRGYASFSLKFSPLDLGIPSSGDRVWTWFRLVGVVNLVAQDVSVQMFEDVFFRLCVCDASVYMVVDSITRGNHKRAWARKHGVCVPGDMVDSLGALDPLLLETELSALDVAGPFCDATFRIRLRKYDHMAASSKGKSEVLSCQLANLMQNAELFHSTSKYAPRLLKQSYLFDLKRRHEVIAPQHYLMMGFPFPGLVPESASKYFPFPSIVDINPTDGDPNKLDDASNRKLTGLSFHWACIGALMMYAWGVART
jgi:hypothetical protein